MVFHHGKFLRDADATRRVAFFETSVFGGGVAMRRTSWASAVAAGLAVLAVAAISQAQLTVPGGKVVVRSAVPGEAGHLMIQGFNFGVRREGLVALDLQQLEIVSWDDGQIVVEMPDLEPGTYLLTVMRGRPHPRYKLTSDDLATLDVTVGGGAGAVGPQGEQGPQGADGQDGQDGAPGLPGANGVSGHVVVRRTIVSGRTAAELPAGFPAADIFGTPGTGLAANSTLTVPVTCPVDASGVQTKPFGGGGGPSNLVSPFPQDSSNAESFLYVVASEPNGDGWRVKWRSRTPTSALSPVEVSVYVVCALAL